MQNKAKSNIQACRAEKFMGHNYDTGFYGVSLKPAEYIGWIAQHLWGKLELILNGWALADGPKTAELSEIHFRSKPRDENELMILEKRACNNHMFGAYSNIVSGMKYHPELVYLHPSTQTPIQSVNHIFTRKKRGKFFKYRRREVGFRILCQSERSLHHHRSRVCCHYTPTVLIRCWK